VPTFRLTRIYRQSQGSLIVTNAHRILDGEEPELPEPGDRKSDFYFFPADDPVKCAERVVEVVTQRIPQNFGLVWTKDVQVLAPMYKGDCGVDALNERLREERAKTMKSVRELRQGARVWRVGDRVIHTRNDYEKEVFNGDMGEIVRVTDENGLVVRFPEREVPYTGAEVGDLQPAFAITVHRSQGGEFPAVVFPLVTQHYVMLQRHLLYTAVTRAKQLVVLVGSRRALGMAIENAEQGQRESALAERLAKLAGA
jgi:exodeoxyribonuclease V alpha subunit